MFAALAPITGGASIALKVVGTAITSAGAITTSVESFTNNNAMFIRNAKEEEARLKKDVKDLENRFILYLTALQSHEDTFSDELTGFKKKLM